MDIDKLNKWADLLLDTGKRNNLINFRDAKTGTVEIVCPDFESVFSKAEHSFTFEVYDPKLDDEEEEDAEEQNQDTEDKKRISKNDYIETYERRLKKQSQILIYNQYVNPIRALRNIGKKAKTAIEETGVNVAYMAFGFINWTESDNSDYTMRAPILLVPISIENDSAIDPYYIQITDSDIVVNPTFSFKLQNDYGIKLPEYEDEGIDEYLNKIESLISKLKWSITKECKIGIFSFLKINMHKDLKNNAEIILKNDCVRTLLGEDVDNDVIASDKIDIDYDKAIIDLHNVVDADSSQEEAIEMARNGKSFVLQGPPGTGKSQTITNIIAECLACDKKVLFVSEKLAALSVVYDKLKKAGLEEFCLELHSHKANKKEVIENLCHTLKAQKSAVNDRAQKEIELKIAAQKKLNDYATELHTVRPIIDKTLYQLYEEISSCRKVPDTDYIINDINHKGEEYIEKAVIALNRYVEYTSSIGYDYHQNCWFGYINTEYSYQNAMQIKSDLQAAFSLCEKIKELNAILTEKFSIKASIVKQAYYLRDFFNLVKQSEYIIPVLLNSSALSTTLKLVKDMSILAKEILDKKEELDNIFDEDVYKLDGQTLYKKFTKQFGGFFSRLFSSEYRKISNDIKLCKKDGKKVKYKDALSWMEGLRTYQQKSQEFNTQEIKIKSNIGSSYNGVNTNFEILISELALLEQIQTSNVDFGMLINLSADEFVSYRKIFSETSDLIQKYFANNETAEKRVNTYFDHNEFDVRLADIDVISEKYKHCVDNIDKLDNWCEFIKLLFTLSDFELRQYIDYTIERKTRTEIIVPTYKKAFYMQWVDYILHGSAVLTELSRIPHDQAIKQFKEKDELNFEINKAKIRAKLSAERPDLDMVAQGSSISILLREGEKKRKQKSIRTLLGDIGELVQTLKPCFLMSPLSVSTFLSPDIKFDVVVFDEASQIFPQDAVGAIYRGKQLIVVGDSKQMPPSNFFNSMTDQDDYDEETEDITDFESILDLCSTTFTQKRLKWHYRSRFEQLISFSNKNFYDNDLVTFPSYKKDSLGQVLTIIMSTELLTENQKLTVKRLKKLLI